MAAAVLMESYLMAFGLAVTMGESEDEAHLFARNYDCVVKYSQLKQDFADFVNRRTELQRCNHRHQIGYTRPSDGENIYQFVTTFEDAEFMVSALRKSGITAWHSFKDCTCK